DGIGVNAPARLFRYDFNEGRFVEEKAKVSVTSNGKFIETEPGAIKETSIYFVAALQTTTTISGRILETKDLRTPVVRASVSFRGRETYTDGNGSYTLRYVPVKANGDNRDEVSFEATVLRASGRVDRIPNPPRVPAVIGGITKMPPAFMPGTENRPPTVLVPPEIEIVEGKSYAFPLQISDPDPGQTVTASVEGPSFVSLKRELSENSTAYSLLLSPNFTHAG